MYQEGLSKVIITMKMYKYQHGQRFGEDGFASIVIALVMITVLALITVSFAQLARREQQSALSKQLASQANYAVESGINDLKNKIPQMLTLENSTLSAGLPSKINTNTCLSDEVLTTLGI